MLGEDTRSATFWPVTRAMLRLGHKYQADAVISNAKERVRVLLPDKIQDWDRVWTDHAPHKNLNVIELANLTRLLEYRALHGRALYRCAQLSAADLVAGTAGVDGKLESLCQQDLISCIKGQGLLRQSLVRAKLEDILDRDDFDDPCAEDCDLDPVKLAFLSDLSDSLTHDPLEDVGWTQPGFFSDCNICAGCMQQILLQFRRFRQRELDGMWKRFAVELGTSSFSTVSTFMLSTC